ncbi:hypothetical protein [Staphylococcus epidermidis]|uniref:hypothetical protein n=1 Tax=Staphylococcus epidermidis TaxID=1282 RepID=UPI00352DA8A2
MELIELLTTMNTNNVQEITYDDKNVLELNEFIIEYNISNSMLDEADNDLRKLSMNDLSQRERDAEAMKIAEEDYNYIIKKYENIANRDIFTVDFEIVGDKVNVRLS